MTSLSLLPLPPRFLAQPTTIGQPFDQQNDLNTGKLLSPRPYHGDRSTIALIKFLTNLPEPAVLSCLLQCLCAVCLLCAFTLSCPRTTTQAAEDPKKVNSAVERNPTIC